MKIRKASAADVSAITLVHLNSWKSTYKNIVPKSYLSGMNYESRLEFWNTILTTPNRKDFVYVVENQTGYIVGFAYGGPERSGKSPYKGELYAIYMLESYQRHRNGRNLMLSLIGEFLKRGIDSMMVWVLSANPSKGFYEFIGGRIVDEKHLLTGNFDLKELAFGWNNLSQMSAHISHSLHKYKTTRLAIPA